MKNRYGSIMLIVLPFLVAAMLGFIPVDADASWDADLLHWNMPPVASPASMNLTSPLGTNLWFFRNWVSEYSMIDAFKQSQAWIPQCQPPDCAVGIWDTGESALFDLDSNGWVRSLPALADPPTYTSVATQMFNGFGANYPGGQYIVLYDGAGTLVYSGDAVKNNALSVAGRDVITVTPAGGIILRITATDPSHTGNYIRNIRVVPAAYEATYATQIFHPDFLAKIQDYRALRFAQWMNVNSSTQSSWSTRSHTSDARWNNQTAGMPIEIMVALANRTNADPWFNLPHMADDNYFTQFATLVRDSLAPNLKVYVEYSNEVWNGSYGYNQSYWVQNQATMTWGTGGDVFAKQMNWHGMRTAQMCDIWKSVWGAQSNRVVCVMGAQSGNQGSIVPALDCPLWAAGRPCYSHGINVLAIGPYFGGYLGYNQYITDVIGWTQDADGGLNKLFTEVITGGILPNSPSPSGALARAFTEISMSNRLIITRGVSLVAYEGGSHFASTSGNLTVTNLFSRATHDARMGDVYDRYLAGWRARGGTLFMHYFNVGQVTNLGSFGALDYMNQSSSPKYDALMRFISNNSCWWINCAGALLATNPMTNYLPFVQK